jgi:hypothetical protein
MNHFIPLEEAVNMTTRFRQHHDELLKEEYKGRNILCKSETFDKEAIAALLVNTDCTRIRIYYGMDEEMKVHAILVGVNASDEDILDPLPSILPSGEAVIVETGVRCPDYCPPDSPLNS